MSERGNGSPMWLTHHWPDQHDRCLRAGRVLVCRRCAVLYPLTVLFAAIALLTEPGPVLAVVAMWMLPLPMTLEWVAEHRGELGHSPARLTLLSAIAAAGIGVALAAHVRHPFDPDALAPMATHATICAIAALRAHRAPAPAGVGTWEQEHEQREAEREASLRRLLEQPDGDPRLRD